MPVTVTIDWLAMTMKMENSREQEFISQYASFPDVQDIAPRNGYKSARVDGNGAQLFWNVDRPEMGFHVVFPGSSLRSLESRNICTIQSLLHSAVNCGGRFTRLDIATDLIGEPIDGQEIYEPLIRGRNEGTARTFSKVESNGGGFTIYIGSRQSEKFVRIYNKAAQEQLPDGHWWRYEIETKGMVARALAVSLDNSGDWHGVFEAVALAMCDLPLCTEYDKFFKAEHLGIGVPKLERVSDREKWIDQQVTPAVLKYFQEHRDSEAVNRLIALLKLVQNGQM